MRHIIANNFHWRTAFFIVAAVGICTVTAIKICVRDVGRLPDKGFKGQFKFLTTLPPWLIFGGVLAGHTDIYCWYSYIDPMLTETGGFAVASLPWLMAIAGFGMFADNLISGRLCDRFKPSAVAALVMASAIPVLILFYLFASAQVFAVVLMMLGTAALFCSGNPLQSSIVCYSKGEELLGAACIQVGCNAGNAIAAYIGGRAINAGMGITSPALVGAPIVALGVILLIVLYRRNERNGAVHHPYGFGESADGQANQ